MVNFLEVFERIKRLSLDELAKDGIYEMLASGTEELGELARAIQIEEKRLGKAHKKLDESSQIEAIDSVITSLSIYFARGGTIEQIVSIMNTKLDKWEKNVQ